MNARLTDAPMEVGDDEESGFAVPCVQSVPNRRGG